MRRWSPVPFHKPHLSHYKKICTSKCRTSKDWVVRCNKQQNSYSDLSIEQQAEKAMPLICWPFHSAVRIYHNHDSFQIIEDPEYMDIDKVSLDQLEDDSNEMLQSMVLVKNGVEKCHIVRFSSSPLNSLCSTNSRNLEGVFHSTESRRSIHSITPHTTITVPATKYHNLSMILWADQPTTSDPIIFIRSESMRNLSIWRSINN